MAIRSYLTSFSHAVKAVFEGQPVIKKYFLRTLSYLPHVNEPAINGHLSCRDTIWDIEVSEVFYSIEVPLNTGFTV